MIVTEVPIGVYKLNGEDKDPLGALGLMMREPLIRTNAGRMSAVITASTQQPDRSGDVVVTKGIRLEGHRKNPICLLNHNRQAGIGFAEDKLGAYTVKMNGETRLAGEIYFNQNTELGVDTFRAVEGRVMRGVSIGFLPVVGMVEKRNDRGAIYHQTDLVEISVTPIPDNEDTLIEAVHKTFGKKPPCGELAALLPSLDYKPTVVTGGWDADLAAKGNTYKSQPPQDVEPQYRSAVYYTCPHCKEEMPPDSIYREADGETTRHGPCRGHVRLKPALTQNNTQTENLTHATGGAENVSTAKTLGEYITNRLRHLRSKGMATYPPPDQDVDEFAPVDSPDADNPDLAADPHADHKQVVDDAVGNILASIYDKFTSGAIEMKEAVKLFKDCLQHHGNVANLDGGDPGEDGDDGDGADDPDGTDDFGDSFDDDVDYDEDGDGKDDPPDLTDKKKKKAEKAIQDIWASGYVPGLEGVADGLAHIVNAVDPDPRKVQKYARTLLGKMAKLPQIDAMVTKALNADEAWAEWEGAFFNGRH